jgi:ABC-2 type transport system permease protein
LTGPRAAAAIARHQLRLGRAQLVPTVITVMVPINFLILFTLFALSGGNAPVATYPTQDHSPAAPASPVALDHALRAASTFRVNPEPSQAAASAALAHDDVVATIGVPPGLDHTVVSGQGATLPVTINNLNADFADDIRRGLPLAILHLYEDTDRHALPVTVAEADSYPHTVSFLAYIAVSIEAVALLLGGLIQGGLSVAREWEHGTMKELMLAPVPAWSVVAGKLGASLLAGVISSGLVLGVLVALGIHPQSWLALIAVMLVLLTVFAALGLAAGSTLRSTRAVIPLAFAVGLPLFFISGAFGPISWTTTASAAIARLFPVAYANAVIQHATYGFFPLDATTGTTWAILVAWAVGGLVTSAWAYRRAIADH